MEKCGVSWIRRALVLLLLLDAVHGWGKEGHFVICKIAEEYLSEDAVAAVKELLPESAEGDLANVCSWADHVRWHYHWSSPLHYVDTPDFRCNYDYCRDCHDSHGNKDRCVTGAIFNYTMQLETFYDDSISKSRYNLTEALMFLSHFIGDVHQPLHCGFLGDLGGNTIVVRWFRRKTNLHHVWDTMIIESALKTFYGREMDVMIEAIQKNITDGWFNDIPSWKHCQHNRTVCPDPYDNQILRACLVTWIIMDGGEYKKYASESISLACKYAYRNATPGTTLQDEYFLSRLPVVNKRLAQAGIRLAATLNRLFASPTKIAAS